METDNNSWNESVWDRIHPRVEFAETEDEREVDFRYYYLQQPGVVARTVYKTPLTKNQEEKVTNMNTEDTTNPAPKNNSAWEAMANKFITTAPNFGCCPACKDTLSSDDCRATFTPEQRERPVPSYVVADEVHAEWNEMVNKITVTTTNAAGKKEEIQLESGTYIRVEAPLTLEAVKALILSAAGRLPTDYPTYEEANNAEDEITALLNLYVVLSRDTDV